MPRVAPSPLFVALAGLTSLVLYQRKRTSDAAESEEEIVVPVQGVKRPKNDLLLRALAGQPTHRVPVWLMRQAGRYLPEFREMRKTIDFFTMCNTPAYAAEVTIQPLRRFKTLDACIIFSDILIVPQAMGMEVLMVKEKGPVFPEPLEKPEDLARLIMKPDAKKAFKPLCDAITLTRKQLKDEVPLIGFAGGPWTLMAYMIQGGGGSKTQWHKAKNWIYNYPKETHQLLSAITSVIIDLLLEAHRAGAQALQVFESCAGDLTPRLFEEFSQPYLLQIVKAVRARVLPVSKGGPPMICFARGAHYSLPTFKDSAYDALGIDWAIEPAEVRRVLGADRAIQGNLDPTALYGSPSVIRREVRTMLEGFGNGPMVGNLGHGCQPFMNPEHIGAFITAVQEESAKLRGSSASAGSVVASPASPSLSVYGVGVSVLIAFLAAKWTRLG